jgi:hypothetical protein
MSQFDGIESVQLFNLRFSAQRDIAESLKVVRSINVVGQKRGLSHEEVELRRAASQAMKEQRVYSDEITDEIDARIEARRARDAATKAATAEVKAREDQLKQAVYWAFVGYPKSCQDKGLPIMSHERLLNLAKTRGRVPALAVEGGPAYEQVLRDAQHCWDEPEETWTRLVKTLCHA